MEVPLYAGAVEFNEVECCAMERASAQEIHQPLIREYMVRIGEAHPVYKAHLLLEIFKYMFSPVFVPASMTHCTLYSCLASAEKNVLGQKQREGFVLDCEHTIQEHCDALDAVCIKMALSQKGDTLIRGEISNG